VVAYVAEQPIAAVFWSLSKCICHLSAANSSSLDRIFWISLPLGRSILQVEDN